MSEIAVFALGGLLAANLVLILARGAKQAAEIEQLTRELNHDMTVISRPPDDADELAKELGLENVERAQWR